MHASDWWNTDEAHVLYGNGINLATLSPLRGSSSVVSPLSDRIVVHPVMIVAYIPITAASKLLVYPPMVAMETHHSNEDECFHHMMPTCLSLMHVNDTNDMPFIHH